MRNYDHLAQKFRGLERLLINWASTQLPKGERIAHRKVQMSQVAKSELETPLAPIYTHNVCECVYVMGMLSEVKKGHAPFGKRNKTVWHHFSKPNRRMELCVCVLAR